MTLAELYDASLRKMQVTAAGEAGDPDDTQLMASKYVMLYDMLRGRKLVSWTGTGDIPDFAAIPVTNMMAFISASEFGLNPAEFSLEGGVDLPIASLAERQLRSQLENDFVYEPARTDYF